MKNFENKKILITGSASGIGKLMAISLAKRRAQLILIDINADALSDVEREIKVFGGKAKSYPLDLSDLNAIKKLRDDVISEFSQLDVLINNAGVVFGGDFEKQSIEKHLLTYQININALVALTHAFFNDLRKSSDANIVNIASASGLIGLPFGTTYASSKWAVIGFSESIRLELAERKIKNVHVTTVCPSYISTGMFNGVKALALLPWLRPDVIVEKIIWGIETNKAFVKEPYIVKWVDLLKGIFPVFVFDKIAKIIGVSSSMTHWKGRN